MFTTEPIKRDRDGYYKNPQLYFDYDWHYVDEEDITSVPEAEGMEFCFVYFKEDAPAHLVSDYVDHGNCDVSEWEPSRPDGKDWFLLAIIENEEQPFACFTRPQTKGATAA